jgi:1,4-alpha-glucan branching enzyme
LSPLEVLRRENELLKQTITDAQVSISELESSLTASDVPIPPAPVDPTVAAVGAPGAVGAPVTPRQLQPEDYWSPALDVPPGYGYHDEYGRITPMPNHDGTECFKWDNTLWSHAEHFKACGGMMAMLMMTIMGRGCRCSARVHTRPHLPGTCLNHLHSLSY